MLPDACVVCEPSTAFDPTPVPDTDPQRSTRCSRHPESQTLARHSIRLRPSRCTQRPASPHRSEVSTHHHPSRCSRRSACPTLDPHLEASTLLRQTRCSLRPGFRRHLVGSNTLPSQTSILRAGPSVDHHQAGSSRTLATATLLALGASLGYQGQKAVHQRESMSSSSGARSSQSHCPRKATLHCYLLLGRAPQCPLSA